MPSRSPRPRGHSSVLNRGAGGLAGLCLLTSLSAACTVKPARPAIGAALVDATAIDDGHGLLVFRETLEDERSWRLMLAKHDTQGAIAWTRAIALPRRTSQRPPVIFGGSALLVLEDETDSAQSLLHVDLERGDSRTWTSQLPKDQHSRVWRTIGDGAQVFVFWIAHGDPMATHQVTAYDAGTGERQWTVTGEVAPGTLAERWPIRLDAGWLMYSDGERDWQLLRRSDGRRSAVVVDPPGLCQAGGRWWGQRDDRLLALDTRDEEIVAREVVAEFITPEWRHQWSLTDCGEADDEVVLITDAGPNALVVAVDPASMHTRWSLPLPTRETPRTPTDVPAGPRRFGAVALVSGSEEHCAVDLERRALLWCVQPQQRDVVIVDGADSLLYTHTYEAQFMVRISGDDGDVDAAVEVTGSRRRDLSTGDGLPSVVGGKIWLASETDPGSAVGGRLPHVVLDARTLRPIERPAFTFTGAPDPDPPQIFVRDVLGELETLYVQPPTDRSIRPAWVAIDPLEEWTFGGPRPAGARDPVFPGLRDAALDSMRARAGLEPDARVQVIAWRVLTGVVHGYDDEGQSISQPARRHDMFAVHVAPDGSRFVLFKLDGFTDDPLMDGRIYFRSFERRPSESDLHLFLLSAASGWEMMNFDSTNGTTRGVIDEQVWSAVTGSPRTQQWMR
jgi:hypothetical protein